MIRWDDAGGRALQEEMPASESGLVWDMDHASSYLHFHFDFDSSAFLCILEIQSFLFYIDMEYRYSILIQYRYACVGPISIIVNITS